MAVSTLSFVKKDLNAPDEVREFPLARIEVVDLGVRTLMRATFQPGWRWSQHVKPLVGTEYCEVEHIGVIISGRLGTRMRDGREIIAGPGECAAIPPGHDGWVVGDEPAVFLDFSGGKHYGRK